MMILYEERKPSVLCISSGYADVLYSGTAVDLQSLTIVVSHVRSFLRSRQSRGTEELQAHGVTKMSVRDLVTPLTPRNLYA